MDTTMGLSELVPYAQVEWSALTADLHPLDWIMGRGLSAYYRIDRNLHLAVTRHRRYVGKASPVTSPYVAPERIEFPFKGPNPGLSLLRLDDDNLRDLRATGVIRLREFRLGGLAPFLRVHGGDRPTNSMFEEVDFHWCILVDRMAWDKLKRSKVNDFLRQELEDLPETVTVQCSDLYFEADDVTPLEVARGGAGRASLVVPTDALPPCEGHKEPYPFENPVRPLPERLLWIYRAAFAHRNKSDARPEDFKTWLREHSCVKLVDTRQWRTVRILAPRRSRKDRSFNEDLLGQLPNGRALLAKDMAFLGTAMKCALAAHHWWIEQDAPTRAERTELLGGKLLELGFTGSTAIQDLLQIIADLRVEEGEMGALMAKLETRARLTEAKRSMAADRAGMQKDAHRAAAFEGVPLQVSDDDHTGIQVIEEAVEDSEAALLYPPIRARL